MGFGGGGAPCDLPQGTGKFMMFFCPCDWKPTMAFESLVSRQVLKVLFKLEVPRFVLFICMRCCARMWKRVIRSQPDQMSVT